MTFRTQIIDLYENADGPLTIAEIADKVGCGTPMVSAIRTQMKHLGYRFDDEVRSSPEDPPLSGGKMHSKLIYTPTPQEIAANRQKPRPSGPLRASSNGDPSVAQTIIEYLQQTPSGAAKADEIAEVSNLKIDSVRRTLWRLARQGEVIGSAGRYRLVSSVDGGAGRRHSSSMPMVPAAPPSSHLQLPPLGSDLMVKVLALDDDGTIKMALKNGTHTWMCVVTGMTLAQ